MSLEQVRKRIFSPTDLDLEKTASCLAGVFSNSVDYADVYFQHRTSEGWHLEEGIVKNGSYNIASGMGVRTVSGDKSCLAYSDEVSVKALQQSVRAARSIASRGGSGEFRTPVQVKARQLYPAINPVRSMARDKKIELITEMDHFTRALDSCVKRVTISMSAVSDAVLIMATDGTLASDVRPVVNLTVHVVVEKSGRREEGYAAAGTRGPLSYFLEDINGETRAMRLCREAVRTALINLEAVPAPAGQMTVVLGHGWPAVLLHEAVGHGLEGDAIRKNASAFEGLVGEQVISPLCTVLDDGTIDGRRGSLTVDDEGTPGQKTVLIENGVLKNFMYDKLNARLMKTASTGNGRRESYSCMPIPRMTNTYMLPGKSDPEEIISSVDHGIYAVSFHGGQVDTASGKFVFTSSEADLIEKGKITTPVKDATLIGSGREVMSKVSMVGNDLMLDPGFGSCGKAGQWVPVGLGQPTLKVDSITVGGTRTS